MTTDEYLSLYSTYEGFVIANKEELDQLGEKMYGIKPLAYGEKVTSSCGGDRMSDTVVKKIMNEEHYINEMRVYSAKMEQIKSQIKTISRYGKKYYMILHAKYVLGWGIAKISREYGYSLSQTRRIYNSALAKFSREYSTTYLLKKRDDYI